MIWIILGVVAVAFGLLWLVLVGGAAADDKEGKR